MTPFNVVNGPRKSMGKDTNLALVPELKTKKNDKKITNVTKKINFFSRFVSTCVIATWVRCQINFT